MAPRVFIVALFALLTTLTQHIFGAPNNLDRRVAVVKFSNKSTYWAFGADFENKWIAVATSSDGRGWTQWSAIKSEACPVATSNPVATVDSSLNTVVAYAQCGDGQVYSFTLLANGSFAVTNVTYAIPLNLKPTEFTVDSVKILEANDLIHLFVQSQSNESRLFYSYKKAAGSWSKFIALGDDSNFLKYDFDVVFNYYVKRIEAFATFPDGHIKHTWQTSPNTFAGGWHKLLTVSSPHFDSTPAAHSMGYSFFNGVVELFARSGTQLHHLYQTTCDTVSNPWGPCTWELGFQSVGGKMPSRPDASNPLAVSNNVHLGLEVFVVGASDGHLYHLWQAKRGSSWSDWEDLGAFSDGSTFKSQATIVVDDSDWWIGYGLSSNAFVVQQFLESPHSFTLSTSTITFNTSVMVSWNVPPEQSTNQDWIAVIPKGGPNNGYLDYRYIQGGQNPASEEVPKGMLSFETYLPNGEYDYRYLANHKYASVLQTTATVTGNPNDPEWVQVYRGIDTGLGKLNINITRCVKDGNATIAKFKASFRAFEDRKIFDGINLFGQALQDIYETLVQCEETTIVEDLEKFIKDLIQCTEKNCVNFLVDLGLDIVILYERIYEIYGDILGAKNSFDVDAYEMGGVCIGRVTWACLALPS